MIYCFRSFAILLPSKSCVDILYYMPVNSLEVTILCLVPRFLLPPSLFIDGIIPFREELRVSRQNPTICFVSSFERGKTLFLVEATINSRRTHQSLSSSALPRPYSRPWGIYFRNEAEVGDLSTQLSNAQGRMLV